MRILFIIFSITFLIIHFGCSKKFLDVKPDKKVVKPETLDDLSRMLNHSIFYTGASLELSVVATDDYFVNDIDLNSIRNNRYSINAYKFEKDIFEDESSNDWNRAYNRILISNIVLGCLDTINLKSDFYNEVKGSALFHRASNYYQLAQLFCEQYDANTAENSPCLPLRLTNDISTNITQGTLNDIYNLMIKDLTASLELLPNLNNIYRPSKPVAHQLLAKIYLHMGEYENTLLHSSLALSYKNDLIDFNQLDSTENYVFADNYLGNKEVLLVHEGTEPPTLSISRHNISEELLNMYEINDLRKSVFFKKHTNGNIVFRGCYKPYNNVWGGFSINELWLIKAESECRLGHINESLNSLNHLLKYRYKNCCFIPINELKKEKLLKIILDERRKELVFRGNRWEDLRRLNKEEAFAKMLTKKVDGQIFTLPINSPNWVYPFPKLELEIHGWTQFDRH